MRIIGKVQRLYVKSTVRYFHWLLIGLLLSLKPLRLSKGSGGPSWGWRLWFWTGRVWVEPGFEGGSEFGIIKKSPVGMNRLEPCSGEKLAAELLWLAQKLVACGCAEEAVSKWAVASNLAWLGLWAQPRLQGSLVKISAFLFKQAKILGLYEIEESKKEQQRQTKKKMLLSWLPLLCRASNGTDVPILSMSERVELEKVLEESIEMLEQEEDQEQVLSLWLHHFTYCPSSDWPNLHASYTRWCNASRKLLVLQ
ncbi:hypothetical protein CFP56_032930 [Quercus suber]|uniref:Uncharacterized protein n=1 Tax=Quercus suber TaxID=58331 RepID=A0AAW0JG42_QUESU